MFFNNWFAFSLACWICVRGMVGTQRYGSYEYSSPMSAAQTQSCAQSKNFKQKNEPTRGIE